MPLLVTLECDEDRRGRAIIRRQGNTGNPFLPLPRISKQARQKVRPYVEPARRALDRVATEIGLANLACGHFAEYTPREGRGPEGAFRNESEVQRGRAACAVADTCDLRRTWFRRARPVDRAHRLPDPVAGRLLHRRRRRR